MKIYFGELKLRYYICDIYFLRKHFIGNSWICKNIKYVELDKVAFWDLYIF